MKTQMRAVGQPHGDRRMRRGNRINRGLLVHLFIAVPFAAGYPPGRAFRRNVELRRLVGDAHRLEAGLRGQFVAKTHAVIEQAEPHIHQTCALHVGLLEADQQVIVIVGDEAPLAPGLFPAILAAAFFRPCNGKAAHHVEAVGQDETQLGGRDQQPALARQRPDGPAVIVGGHCQRNAAIGRGCRHRR